VVLQHLYIFGGFLSQDENHTPQFLRNQLWRFSVTTQSWEMLHQLAGVLLDTACAVVGTHITVFGGIDDDDVPAACLYTFDCAASEKVPAWVAHHHGSPSGTPAPRISHCAAAVSDSLYLFGGICQPDDEVAVDVWRWQNLH
jgi:N-acetylneuraminic acid mutarotase